MNSTKQVTFSEFQQIVKSQFSYEQLQQVLATKSSEVELDADYDVLVDEYIRLTSVVYPESACLQNGNYIIVDDNQVEKDEFADVVVEVEEVESYQINVTSFSDVDKTLLRKCLYKDLAWNKAVEIHAFLYIKATPVGEDVHYWVVFLDNQGNKQAYPIYRSELRSLRRIVESETELDVEQAWETVTEQVKECSSLVKVLGKGARKVIQCQGLVMEFLLRHGEIIWCTRYWIEGSECNFFQDVNKKCTTYDGLGRMVNQIKSDIWFELEVVGVA